MCCVDGKFGEVQYKCEDLGFINCVADRTIQCDDRSDCPGNQVCCGRFDEEGYTGVSCRADCNDIPGVQAVRFCSPTAAPDECAEIGKTCQKSQSLPGYYVCK